MKQTVFFGLILLLGLSACTAQPTPAPTIAPTVIPDPFRPTAPEAVRDELFDQVGFFLTNPVYRDGMKADGTPMPMLDLPLVATGDYEIRTIGDIRLHLVDAYVLSKDQNVYRLWVAVAAEKGDQVYLPFYSAAAETLSVDDLSELFYRGRLFSVYVTTEMSFPNQVQFAACPPEYGYPEWYQKLAEAEQTEYQSYVKRLMAWSLEKVPADWILAGWMVSLYPDSSSLMLSEE